MARMTPEEIQAKWAARTSAASADYAAGVSRVTVAPGQAAAAKYDKWQAGLQASGAKWRANVQRPSLSEWQQRTIEIGQSRFAAGVQAKQDKMGAFLRDFIPHLDAVTNRVRAMPDTSPEDRINRMVAQVRGVSQFKRGR